ncbi:hypothetical protein [Niastella vici]|nr:hypothetical protein [Niastella vici]
MKIIVAANLLRFSGNAVQPSGAILTIINGYFAIRIYNGDQGDSL